MDLESVKGAITSIKLAGEIAKTFVDLKSQAEINARVVDLQSVILEAQGALFAANDTQRELLAEIDTLKAKIIGMDQWATEQKRYRLYSPRDGMLFYALTQATSNGEPAHYLCTNCFQTGRKSILNQGRNSQAWTQFECPACRATISTGHRGSFPLEYASEATA